jgi:hypothetical protein
VLAPASLRSPAAAGLTALFLGLGACAPAAEPQGARAACERSAFPDDPAISAAFTDRFNGRYWNNEEQVTVWREGQRLFIGAPPRERVQLQRSAAGGGEGNFRDGCGTTYQFILPPDGPGGYVVVTEPNGARSEWHRRV